MGIWFVELVLLFVSLLYAYKATALFWSRDIAFFSALSLVFFICDVLESGNLSEEYAIPFISISQYYFLRFFKERKIRHTHFSIIVACFVCVLLLKANGATSWLVGWVMVAFLLLKEKRVVDLWRVAFVSLGVSVLTLLPFFAYFYLTDSLSDFQYCYWDFNRAYSDVSYAIVFQAIKVIKRLFSFVDYVFPFLSFFILVFIVFNKPRKHKSPILFYFIAFAATAVAVALSGRKYSHYYFYFVPILPCFYAIVYDFVKKQLKSYKFLFLFALVLVVHSGHAISWAHRVPDCYKEQEDVNEVVSFINEHTQPGDKIYVVGNECIFYILSHRESASKYPYLFPIATIEKYSDRILNQFYQDMEINRPKVICRKPWREVDGRLKEIPDMNEFLEKNYEKAQNIGGHDCYLIKAK